MSCKFPLAQVFVLAMSLPVFALDYWLPNPDGNDHTYVDQYLNQLDVDFFMSDETHQMMETHDGFGMGAVRFEVTAAGLRMESSAYASEATPEIFEYDPPLPMIPADLAGGQTWLYTGTVTHSFLGQTTTTPLTAQASATAETITVPMGEFNAIHVHYDLQEGWTSGYLDMWYALGLGPVRMDEWELLSVELPVAVESHSWSAVKQLFD